jgi:hypothetical protein
MSILKLKIIEVISMIILDVLHLIPKGRGIKFPYDTRTVAVPVRTLPQ